MSLLSLLRWLLRGEDYEPRGSAWATRELFKRGAAAIDAGELVKPRVIAKRPNPKLVAVPVFKCRLLRAEFKRKAGA